MRQCSVYYSITVNLRPGIVTLLEPVYSGLHIKDWPVKSVIFSFVNRRHEWKYADERCSASIIGAEFSHLQMMICVTVFKCISAKICCCAPVMAITAVLCPHAETITASFIEYN